MPLIKTPKLISPNVNGSSDESFLEIGWDDNSSSPTTILQAGKAGKCMKKDISTLLNEISKQKHNLGSSEVVLNTEKSLSTWMQTDLVLTRKNRNKKSTSKLREVSKKGWQKKGALSFNEELKRFMEVVLPKDNVATCQLITEKTSDSKDISSPDFFQSSKNDSILMNDLQDLDLDDIDISLHQKNKENYFLVKTPKLRRNISKSVTPDDQNIYMPKTSSAKRKNPCRRKQLDLAPQSDFEKNTTSLPSQSLRPKPVLETNKPSLSPITKSQKCEPQISFELNDGLDEILSTQDVFTNEKKGNMDLKNEILDSEHFFPCDDFKKQNHREKTKSDDVMETFIPDDPTPLKTPIINKKVDDVIVFEDDDELDDFVLNLDEEMTCKSQETPPSKITVEQRKLKKRCHTSPFPVSRKHSHKKKAKKFVSDIKNENEDRRLFNSKEPKKISGLVKQDKHDSLNSISRTFASDAVRQPYKAPFDNDSQCSKTNLNFTQTKKDKNYNSDFKKDQNDNINSKDLFDRMNICGENSINLSAIKSVHKNFTGNKKDQYEEWNCKLVAPFSSTQRCSLTEIERKRKEAQSRLQHRLLKKR